MGSFTAAGTIMSLVVGAGMLGLPFVAVQAGFWNVMVQIFFLGLIVAVLNLFVAEIVLRTKGEHQLVKLAEKYLGKRGKRLMFLSFTIGQYGALVAYLVGVKSVLVNLFGSYGESFSWIIIAGMFLLLLYRLRVVARVETFLTVLMIALIIFVCALLIPSVDFSNFTSVTRAPLAGFGVIMFSFMGFTIIPEVVRELGDRRKLFEVIMASYAGIILLYALFVYVFTGAFGSGVKGVAIESLSGVLLFAGSFLTVLLLVTSFIGLGVVMKDLFSLDFKFKHRVPWLLTVLPPLIIFLFSPDFISVLSVVGSFTAGAVGVLVCLMVVKSREKGNRTPEFVVWGHEFLPYFVIVVLLIGVAWQVSALL